LTLELIIEKFNSGLVDKWITGLMGEKTKKTSHERGN